MTFVTFFRKCRQALGLRQCDFLPDFKQSYISQIENGVRPNNAETYHKLAKHLKLGPQGGDFLWAYARFDQDPRELTMDQIKLPIDTTSDTRNSGTLNGDTQDGDIQKNLSKEGFGEYLVANNVSIRIGFTTDKIYCVLGKPDNKVHFGNKEKWCYEQNAIHVVFQDGKLLDVIFK